MLPLPVPPARYETRRWVAESDGMTGRRRLATASGPYESMIPSRIGDIELALPTDLLTDVVEASGELARFDLYATARLGMDSPALGPMRSILLRTESSSSSQIENLTVGARQLALAEIDQSTSDNARTVVANVRAMEAALRLAERLDEDAVLAMQHELISGQRGRESHAGRYRDALVWIGATHVTPIGASHVAPQAEHIRPAMADLVAFIRRDDIPPLVQAAVAHAQFENIHPFADGNGRTGRALVHAMLKAKGTVSDTTAPVSAGLLRDTGAYFRALDAYRAGDARPIVDRFCEASIFASRSGTHLVDDLAAHLDDARVRTAHLRADAAARKVLPHLVASHLINTRYLVDHLGIPPSSAARALDQLTAAGVLEERTGRRRERLWQHSGVIATLDAYAQQTIRQ